MVAFNPRGYRIDVREAPMLRIYVAQDREQGGWLLMMLLHHQVGDHTTLEVMQEWRRSCCCWARGEQLPESSAVSAIL